MTGLKAIAPGALALVLAACGSGAGTTSPSPSPSIAHVGEGGRALGTAKASVEIRDGAFFYLGNGVMPVVNVKIGEIVEWTARTDNTVAHNVSFYQPPDQFSVLDPAIASPHELNAGDKWQVKFTKAGDYRYICTFHTSMTASVVVIEG